MLSFLQHSHAQRHTLDSPGLKSTACPRLRNTDSQTGSVASPIRIFASAGREAPTSDLAPPHTLPLRDAAAPLGAGLASRPADAPARVKLPAKQQPGRMYKNREQSVF